MRYWINCFLALLFIATCSQAQPLQKIFSDWQITCNNLNYCVARNVPGDNGLVMTISRHAGGSDHSLLRIDYGNEYTSELNGSALKDNLLLDGRRLKPDLKHWEVQPHHLSTVHAISIDEFLAQTMDANSIQLLYRPAATISLHGMKAALLLMDEVQGRLNNISAWIRRGHRPISEVPPEPLTPVIVPPAHPPSSLTRVESNGLIDFGTWRVNTDECSLDPQRREVSVSPLDDKKALLLVSCEMGAYNVIDLAYEVSRTEPYLARRITLTLPFMPAANSLKQLDLVNAAFDPDTSQLMTFSKGRGLGDCGIASRWQYTSGGFVLVEYAQEQTCDVWHGSDDWPTLWTSTTQSQPAVGEVEMTP